MELNNKTDAIQPSKGGIIQLCTGFFRSPSDVGNRFVERGNNIIAILFILIKGILISGILFSIFRGKFEEFNFGDLTQESIDDYQIQIMLASAIIFLSVILYSFFSALLYWFIFKIFAKTPITYGQMQRAIGGKIYYVIPSLIICVLLNTVSQILYVNSSLSVIHKVLFIIALFLLIAGIACGNMSLSLWLKTTTGISNNNFIRFSVIAKTILGIILFVFIYFIIHYQFLGLFTDIYMFFRFL